MELLVHRSNVVCLYLNSERNVDACNSRHVMNLKCSVLILSMCGRNIAFNKILQRNWGQRRRN